MRSIAYPLAAGNTCILKGSELSPRIFYAMGKIFSEAGLPAGALNVIFHRPAAAAEITTALIANVTSIPPRRPMESRYPLLWKSSACHTKPIR